MSSLLNNATLLLNPAGSTIAYKEDKIYSVKPNNGTGDFTFTGGDGGTRVNQQGYIEVTPANLASNSNSFTSNSDFTKTGSLPGPFSSTDGNILTPVGSSEKYSSIASLTATANTIYTFSVYAKYLQNTQLALRCVYSNGAQDQSTIFNLQTNTVVSLPGTHSNPQIIPAGGGWFRYSVDINSTTPPAFPFLFRVNAANNGSLGFTPSSGDGFYISSAQVNTGGLKPYQPTTDRLNYPRITYQNGRGALLTEPQRTNLLTYSNGFDLWSYTGITVTTGSAISPDGTQNAVLLTTTNATNHQLYQSKNASGALAYSVWAKKGNSRTFYLAAYNNNFAAYWDLDTGAVISTAGSGVSALPGEEYRDGWRRYTMLFTNVNNEVQIGFLDTYYTGNSAGPWGVSTSVGTTGYIYGAQLEAGLYPTSYIPTTSATVTRPQDVGGGSMSSLVNTSAGTLYLDVTIRGTLTADQFYWGIYDGSGNQIYIGLYSIYGLFRIVNSYSLDVNINPVFELNKRYKFALAYQTNDAVAYMNGNSVGSDTSVSIPSVTNMGINFLNENANIESYTLAYFNSRLTNAQVAELTTVRSGSGGTISYYGPYTIHTFTGSATFTPSFNGEVEVLVVAGGASGGVGSNGGGGGGAGGLLYASSYGVAQGTGITVTVGAGGGSRIGRGSGNNGSNSVFGGLTAIGGGGGGGASAGPSAGKAGGSGGGAQYNNAGGSGVTGQGNNGGDGNYYLGGNHDAGGGGGGAGFAGLDATSTNAGNGGDGLPYSISGFSTYYAGGGGGSSNNQSGTGPFFPGNGGLGGGGKGGIQGTTLLGTDGVDGLGAGGGAGVGSTGGNSGAGGDGIVIVRYLT